jgi:hypothetical protein
MGDCLEGIRGRGQEETKDICYRKGCKYTIIVHIIQYDEKGDRREQEWKYNGRDELVQSTLYACMQSLQ